MCFFAPFFHSFNLTEVLLLETGFKDYVWSLKLAMTCTNSGYPVLVHILFLAISFQFKYQKVVEAVTGIQPKGKRSIVSMSFMCLAKHKYANALSVNPVNNSKYIHQ